MYLDSEANDCKITCLVYHFLYIHLQYLSCNSQYNSTDLKRYHNMGIQKYCWKFFCYWYMHRNHRLEQENPSQYGFQKKPQFDLQRQHQDVNVIVPRDNGRRKGKEEENFKGNNFQLWYNKRATVWMELPIPVPGVCKGSTLAARSSSYRPRVKWEAQHVSNSILLTSSKVLLPGD